MKVGLLVLDTLRHDVFQSELTKTLQRADHVFERMYSTSRWTVPAHASLFTGLYPTEAGTHSGALQLSTPTSTLAEDFQTAGFETKLFSNNVYIDSFFDFDRGFDSLVRGPNLAGRPTNSSGFDWTTLFNELEEGYSRYPRAVARILSSDAPTFPTLVEGAQMLLSDDGEHDGTIDWFLDTFDPEAATATDDLFLFANLMTCHSPYLPPSGYQTVEPYPVDPFELTLRDEPVTDSEHERHWESYKACAAYLDDALEQVIDAVDWDALFIVSDHGELFGEYGLRQHQYGVYEELTHVPAVAIGSSVPDGTTTRMTSLVDVHQTLLEVAGVDAPHDTRGESLFQRSAERGYIYAESVGNYRATPGASGFDEKIPSSWAEPHFLYGTDQALYVQDKDGQRAYTADWRSQLSPIPNGVVSEAEALREEIGSDSQPKHETDVPEELESRLADLGYR